MVHGLGRSQLADWRKHTKGITSKHDDVGWMTTDARDLGIGDVLDGISATGVLGLGLVAVVDNTGKFIVNNVLKDGAKTDSSENFRLLLG
jgi:hypothetical protein